MRARVLVVDEQEGIRASLKSRLDKEGFEVVVASNVQEAHGQLKRGPVAVLIADVKTSGSEGLDLVSSVGKDYPNTRLIMTSEQPNKDEAVSAFKHGALDYLDKPLNIDDVCRAVSNAHREYLKKAESEDYLVRLQSRAVHSESPIYDFWMKSGSKSMTRVTEVLSILKSEGERGDAVQSPVLICGAPGTGKGAIARQIHNQSSYAKGPWVTISCARYSDHLLESEIFGHESGAFSGANQQKLGLVEIAKGGTLYIDEINEMNQRVQDKLLGLLQKNQFQRMGGTIQLETDVRIILGSTASLNSLRQSNQLASGLFEKIQRMAFELPLLSERNEDIIPLANKIAELEFTARGKHFEGFSRDAVERMQNYEWPGNIRELVNLIERAALIWDGNGEVGTKAMGIPQTGSAKILSIRGGGATGSRTSAPAAITQLEPGGGGYMELKRRWSDNFEREYLAAALSRHSGNVSAAAREARIDRSNFLRLLRRHGINAEKWRKLAA